METVATSELPPSQSDRQTEGLTLADGRSDERPPPPHRLNRQFISIPIENNARTHAHTRDIFNPSQGGGKTLNSRSGCPGSLNKPIIRRRRRRRPLLEIDAKK